MRPNDKALVLNNKNMTVVTENMVFVVAVSLSDIPLSDVPPKSKSSVAKLTSYTVVIGERGGQGAGGCRLRGYAYSCGGVVSITFMYSSPMFHTRPHPRYRSAAAADTVIVTADGPVIVTDKLPRERQQVVYLIEDAEDEAAAKARSGREAGGGRGTV